MTNFKEMTQGLVNEVVASMAIEELNSHTLENRFAILDNVEQAVNVLAMNSYDLNRNRRDKVNPKELWNSSLSHSLYSAEWNKLLEGHIEHKAPARACIKANVKHGSSYIPSTPSASTTRYDNNKIYGSDDKEIKPTTSSVYHIVSYRVYRKAVILDIESTETSKVYRSYDEYLNNVTPNDIDHSRDLENDNSPFVHLVFRYQPLTKSGKPNPYCGLEQLKTWLHTLKIVNDNAPATLKDALELLVDETVAIPFAPAYSYTSKADYLTVYTYAGDTEDLEREFV